MQTEQKTNPFHATYFSQDEMSAVVSPLAKVITEYVLGRLKSAEIPYRARVRTADSAQVIKIRSIETSSEIAIVIPYNNSGEIQIRFVKHVDRHMTTTPTRLVMRKIDIKENITSSETMGEFIDNQVIAWLIPSGDNLKSPLVHMLVLEDEDVCPSPLVAIGFVVEHANITADAKGELKVTVANKGRTIVRNNRVVPGVVMTNNRTSLVGRIYVEFNNGDYLFLPEKIFNQQFKFFRAGIVDTSSRH